MPKQRNRAAPARRRRQRNQKQLPGVPLRVVGPGNNPIHRFTRIFDSIVITPTSDSGGAYAFKLSQANGFSELTVLFDQYKIEGVELVFTASPPNSNAAWPRLFVCFDPDDEDVPANKSILLERGNTKVKAFNPMSRSYKVNVVPNVMLSADTSAGSRTALQAPRSSWLDCNQANVNHFGVKYWLEDFNSGLGSPFMKVMMRYHLAFRSSR